MTETVYLGNPNLKKANVQQEWTQEELVEYQKCMKDPIYFIMNYLKIVSLDEGLVPFTMYDFQKEMVGTFHNNRFTICKLPRQSGKSTTIIAYLLHYVLFNPSVNVAILANKAATARDLLSRLQLAYEHMPKWLQQGVMSWNKGSLELENGSKILASSTSASAVRGGSYNIIFLDESNKTVKLSDYKGATLKRVLGSIGVPSLTKLMTDLGLGKKTGNIVAQKFYEGLQIRKNSDNQEINPLRLVNKKIEGISVVFAKCCRPILGDEIIAHSDTERGIVIHHKICQQVVPFLAKDVRYQPALWDSKKKSHLYIAKLKVISENKVGVLSDVLSIFTREGVNVVFVNTNAIDSKFANIDLEIEVNDINHLNTLIDKVDAKKFVSNCSRQINEG